MIQDMPLERMHQLLQGEVDRQMGLAALAGKGELRNGHYEVASALSKAIKLTREAR